MLHYIINSSIYLVADELKDINISTLSELKRERGLQHILGLPKNPITGRIKVTHNRKLEIQTCI